MSTCQSASVYAQGNFPGGTLPVGVCVTGVHNGNHVELQVDCVDIEGSAQPKLKGGESCDSLTDQANATFYEHNCAGTSICSTYCRVQGTEQTPQVSNCVLTEDSAAMYKMYSCVNGNQTRKGFTTNDCSGAGVDEVQVASCKETCDAAPTLPPRWRWNDGITKCFRKCSITRNSVHRNVGSVYCFCCDDVNQDNLSFLFFSNEL